MHFDLRALVEAEADRQIAARRARRLEEVREELREVEAAASAASGTGGAGSESRAGLYQRRRLRVEEKSPDSRRAGRGSRASSSRNSAS